MKKVLVAVVVACGFAAFAENEWYIDPVNGNDLYDGTSSNVVSDTTGPRKTLKGAMEIPELAANDTIWLLPGEYKEGIMRSAVTNELTRRLYVTVAGLRFRSTAGRDRTFIVGQRGGSKGYNSDDAIGCVSIAKAAKNCVFEGITFKDGAARYQAPSGIEDNAGAGLYDGLSKSCWVINCRFTNCVSYATAGAMSCGNASGTEFVDCSASSGSSQFAQGLTYAEFCLFDGGASTASLDNGGTFVNCTFYGNNVSSSQLFYRKTYKLYNCLAYGFKKSCGSHQKSGTPTTPNDVTIYNTYFNIYDGNGSLTVGANSLTNADEWTARFVSPDMGDFRLTDMSDVTQLGDAAYLSLLPATFPEGFARKDVYGNPVTATEGAIPAGCALEVVHQTGCRVDFSAAFEVKELGRTFAANTYYNIIGENGGDYTYMLRPVTTDPVVHNVQGIFGQEYKKNSTTGVVTWPDIKKYFFPLRRKGGWVPVGVRKELVSTNKFTFTSVAASDIYYADPVNGSDAYNGKSSNVVDATTGPFRTLTNAVAKIGGGSGASKILYLMPGAYAEGCSANRVGSGTEKAPYGVRYRLYADKCNLAVIGLEGPEKTFIVGTPDPGTGGIGPDAIGGVFLASGTCKCVQDVTITGCYSTDTESAAYTVAGCAFYGDGSSSTHCWDCIISNNTAYCAPAKSYGNMVRCKILNNQSAQYMCIKGEPVGSCVFAGNEMSTTTRFTDGATYGCTFDAKVSGSLNSATYYSLFLNRKQTDSLNQSYNDTIPLVADPDTFDYRLGSLSPAILFGDLSTRPLNSTYVLVSDVNGDKLEIKDGKMTVGAVHGGLRAPCTAIADGGVKGATVTGGALGTNVVRSAGEVTVTASVTRPLEGFSMDGEIIPATERSYTFTPSTDAGAATFVGLIYGTNWFVSASAASDDTPGGSWAAARQTIRSATTNAVAGDVIHVAPGEYGEKEGSRLQMSAQTRVIVPANVRLQGEGARYAAVIRGAVASEPENEYGMGPDAVRCVYLSAGATLANFTLTEGHTPTNTSGKGSAVYSASTATVTDCFVTNNACYEGTLYQGRNVRCRVIDNTSLFRGALGSGGSYYGCFFDYSKAKDRNLNTPTSVDFCTIGTHNDYFTGTGTQIFGSSSKTWMRNSVMMAGKIYINTSSNYKFYATNCVFSTDVSETLIETFAGCSNCVRIKRADMKLSADGVPAADSPVNNWGDIGMFPDCVNETDLLGVPRVLNGGVDAGAYEHDWRVEYKNDLGPRATAVTAASPEVVETKDHTVRISSGTLEGKLKLGGATMLNFKVQGGTLTVYQGEKFVGEFTTADAEQSVEIWPEEGNDAFRLAFTPSDKDGYAEIARLKKGANGIIFMVR